MAHDYDRRQKTADYVPHGQKLFDRLNEEFNDVHYDPEKGQGWARAGSLGKIEFRESGSDPAVIVTIIPPSFKTDADDAWKVIQSLRKIFQKL
jgi:hypothetical protein